MTKISENISDFIKNERSSQLFKQAPPGILIIAIIAAVEGLYFDTTIYADKSLTVGLYLSLLVVAAALYLFYPKSALLKNLPWLGVAVVASFTALSHLILEYRSVALRPVGFSHCELILLGLLFFPLSPVVFFALAGSIFFSYLILGSSTTVLDLSTYFMSHDFTIFCTFAILIVFGFFFNNRLRTSLYAKSIELKSQLTDRETTIAEQIAEITNANISRAVASTTQMLAHDVRKPFATLKAAVQMIQKAKDYNDVQTVIKLLAPQIDKSFLSVNTMLKDIYGVRGDRANISFQDDDVVDLICTVIDQVLLGLDLVNIQFQYDFQHIHKIKIQKGRIERVFINILSNAIEAMKLNGTIKFQTKEISNKDTKFIQFEVINTNSNIAKELIESLFDPFKTSQKAGGTGLGLAIAKHIIQDHGGTIDCTSDVEKREVKFRFTVLASAVLAEKSVKQLPANSEAVRAKFQPKIVVNALKSQKVDLVVVEDSEFMHTAWTHTKDLNMTVKLFYTPEEFLAAAKLDSSLYTTPKFFLLDYDYGDKSFTDGFRLAELIREHVTGKVFFYSDMDFAEIPKDFDGRVPKEILTLEQLEGFLQPRGLYELK